MHETPLARQIAVVAALKRERLPANAPSASIVALERQPGSCVAARRLETRGLAACRTFLLNAVSI